VLESLIGFVILFLLLFAGLPIGIGMILVGVGGFAYIIGFQPARAMLGQIGFDTPISYSLTILPLFILMGNLFASSRLSAELYRASYSFLGHTKGGLAHATLVACAGFSAVCGSSLATAATMTKVAIPSMREFKYHDTLAAGAVAAGGTLGILIPPSVAMVLYGIMTNNDIGKLFIAGILPGLVALLLFMAAVSVVVFFNPEKGPQGERSSFKERYQAMLGVWGVVVLLLVVIGGIYGGVFTPTEAAAIGSAGAFLFALGRRTLTVSGFFQIFSNTCRTTASIFVVMIGAIVFSNFINVAGLPRELTAFLDSMSLPPMAILCIILLIYILLGCVLETVSMLLLTIPIFYPIVSQLGFDPIWFGIVLVVVIEIGLITPPIGLNIFVVSASQSDIPVKRVIVGVLPFVIADLVLLILLVSFPQISLFLPTHMN